MTRKGGERVEPSACGHVEHLDSVFGLGCSVKGCSNYIAIRKGGGRESGLTVGKTLQRVKSGVAAANPAAANPARTPVYWHRQILGDWHGDRASCVLCHLIEELRAFKAELAALRKEAVKGSWRFRAEEAEARVKELEDRFALEEEANGELRGEDHG